MEHFLQTAGLVFLAELGDKTQILTVALTKKYKTREVIIAISLATLILHFFSVYLGEYIGNLLPPKILNIIVGLTIIIFGVIFLGEFNEDRIEIDEQKPKFNPILQCALIFFLAELADKTMFTTIGLASRFHDYGAVFWGSSVGLILADVMAIIVFTYLGQFMPAKLTKILASFVFVGFGLFTIYSCFKIN